MNDFILTIILILMSLFVFYKIWIWLLKFVLKVEFRLSKNEKKDLKNEV